MTTTLAIPAAEPEATAVTADPAVLNTGASTEVATSTETPAVAAERPSWLPAEFKTPEEFAAKYATLSAPAPAEPPKALKIVTAEEAQAAATAAGVDIAALSKELLKAGALSPESVALLASKGIDQSVVAQHAEGEAAKSVLEITTLATDVGGLETLQAMLDWAKTALTPDEIADYNDTLENGTLGKKKITLGALKARYETVFGTTAARDITGESRPSSVGPKPFASQVEMTAAMSNKAYKTDPAVRAEVARRLAVSGDLVSTVVN